MGIKEDCFAYNQEITMEDKRCSALNSLYCKRENCNFYKTRQQENKDRKKYGYVLRKE